MRRSLLGLVLFASLSLNAQTPGPATTNNVDSCDISETPAATLLLPYFEVDTAATQGTGTTTLFTVTNTSRYPQIAHVTVWTDWGFPVLAFNLFLTGYDVQGINLYDIVVRGVIVPGAPSGTSINTAPGTLNTSTPTLGTISTPLGNTANPNFVTSGPMSVSTTCANLAGQIQPDLAAAVKNALMIGNNYNAAGVSCGTAQIGFNHGLIAKGYITVDVVSYCTSQFPADGSYYTGPTAALLFDNVLAGDYQQIGPTPQGSGTQAAFDAEGGPMVHIHAVPEGGLSGASAGVPISTNLPFTFYDRYTPTGLRAVDRRQPLPSTWNARYIQGGVAGFATDLKIWREGVTGQTNCQTAPSVALNSVIALQDIVRFDEHENSTGLGGFTCGFDPCIPPLWSFPATSRSGSQASFFPRLLGSDVGGWFYLSLSSSARYGYADCQTTLSAQRAGFGNCGNAAIGAGGSRTTSQNWVITSMFGAVGSNRLSVDFDAVALGNGCTPTPASNTAAGPAWQKDGLICPSNAPASSCGAGTVRPLSNP